MAHNNYLVYFDKEDLPSDEGKRRLDELLGQDNVYRLNESTTFAVKADDSMTFTEVQRLIGFEPDSESNVRGIIVELLSGHRNGWYSREFWDFLKTARKEDENVG